METLFDILDKEKILTEKFYNLQKEELKNNVPLKKQKQTYNEFEKQLKIIEKEKKQCLKLMKKI